MPDAQLFDWVAGEVERELGVDRLVARGMIRFALKRSGLDSGVLTRDQLRVVIDKILPTVLEKNGAADPGGVCHRLLFRLDQVGDLADDDGDSTHGIFKRLTSA